MRIACLHTAESNVAVFEAAAAGLDLALTHHVRADLLARAEAEGGLTGAIAAETEALLAALTGEADAVLLTCSTLGPCATGAGQFRVDAALAARAVAGGGRVVVLCAAQTTLAPTRKLFEQAAAGTGAAVELRLVAGAWALFKAGDQAGYLAAIARAADAAFAEGADTVAMSQASMAAAAALCALGVPLTSPSAALAAAMAQAAVRV